MSAGPAPAPFLPPTVSRFFKALRQRRVDEALSLYAAGGIHVSAARVAAEPAARRAFYENALAGWQAGGPVVEAVAGSPAAPRVTWSAQTLAGGRVHGLDEFHLNRRGEIVYHHTTVAAPRA